MSGMNLDSGNNQDFDLNLAPIIDCLTVLIAFMLASASFISIGILDAGVAAAGQAPTDQKPPEVNVSLELSKDNQLVLKLSGKATHSSTIAAKAGSRDFDALTEQLKSIKAKWPSLNALTLTADNSVTYKEVVQAMEVSRKVLPAVLLGGF